MKFELNFKLIHMHQRIKGEGCGVAPPTLVGIFYQIESFLAFLVLQPPPPFPDRLVDKSIHDRLQTPIHPTPFKNFQIHLCTCTIVFMVL